MRLAAAVCAAVDLLLLLQLIILQSLFHAFTAFHFSFNLRVTRYIHLHESTQWFNFLQLGELKPMT
jgi:hypothetical protein